MKQQTGGKVGTTRSTKHSIHQQQRGKQQQREHELLPTENVKGQHWLSAHFVLYQRDQNV